MTSIKAKAAELHYVSKAAEAVVSALFVLSDRHKATKFIGPNLVVKATRRGRFDRRSNNVEMVLTIGRPNHAERKFLKKLKKAGESLPVKKVQLKNYPKK